ncbi:MAG: zinc-dependent metalloprotease [Gemmatimonadota bacterium]
MLKDTRAIEGYFKLHLKRDRTLFLEVRTDQLDQDFGLVLHYSRGLGDFNVHDGLRLSEARLLRFRRVGDQVLLVHRNPRFTADPGSPMRASMEDNVGHSVIAAFDIKSEHETSKNLVVDVTEFFVSDYAGIASDLKFYYGNKPVSFDKKRSHVGQVMGFPRNVEIDAELTFQANDPPAFGGEGVADWRSIPIGVRYSLFALPQDPMHPRLADDRVGHFLTVHKDFSRDQKETPYVRYVNRWRLEKKDPSAEVSEPVEPIVYYVDRSVPVAYRKYVKEGIEGWNKAFEAAGFRNAIVAKEAPDDSTWSAEDVRYSTVRWTAAHRMGYAIGPSQTDPRTGEILNADILISSTFVTSWLYEWQELAGPDAMIREYQEAQRLRRERAPELAGQVCHAEMGKAHQLGLQYALLVGLGRLPGGEPLPEEFLGDAIRDLVMHEVGHTLGLRHNFKASSGIPHERLQDEAFTRQHGVTLSVMDYGPVNVAVDPKRQGHYWNKEVGTYDVWVIRYAYTPFPGSGYVAGATDGAGEAGPEAELAALRKIAEQAADPLHAYGTDEDNWLGTFAVDPLTNAWDLGSDPVAYGQGRVALIRRVQPQLEARLIGEGDGYQRLRGAVNNLIFERYLSLFPVTKTVGGLYVARDHKGDPNARTPFTPVPAAKQREAVALLVEHVFAEDAFRFEPELLNKLAPNRWSHWGVGWLSVPVDFPIHSYVAFVQESILDALLSPVRLQRLIDNEVRTPRGERPYRVSDLFASLTGAAWSELGSGPKRPRAVTSFRRNLQRAHADRLIGFVVSPPIGTPEDARSLARMHLKEISKQIGTALGDRGLDELTRAHLEETQARIGRALEADLSIGVRGR